MIFMNFPRENGFRSIVISRRNCFGNVFSRTLLAWRTTAISNIIFLALSFRQLAFHTKLCRVIFTFVVYFYLISQHERLFLNQSSWISTLRGINRSYNNEPPHRDDLDEHLFNQTPRKQLSVLLISYNAAAKCFTEASKRRTRCKFKLRLHSSLIICHTRFLRP